MWKINIKWERPTIAELEQKRKTFQERGFVVTAFLRELIWPFSKIILIIKWFKSEKEIIR